ncbi:MAG: transporter [Thiomonas sp.]
MRPFLRPTTRTLLALACGASALALPLTAQACATCGCSLSTDAAMGYSAAPGWRVNLQYDFINQNQLRSGTHAVSAASVAALNPDAGQEVEHDTINRYLTLGIGYSPSPDWNFNLQIPYIDRSHTTYGAATPDQLTPDNLSGATVSSLGDVKFIAAWQGLLPTHNLGFQLGVKLPTGRYGGPNADGTGVVGRDPVAFSRGPNAQQPSPGNLLDTSLQPGTGSTDLIVGAYAYQPISQNFDAFVNGQFQAAVAHRLNAPGADYRPGNLASLSFGLRYEAHPDWVPQLQVNLTHKSHDQGALADTADTAGTVAYLSPGLSVTVAKGWQAYGFVQLPVYSQLDGYQLFPHWTASLGISTAF